jgi:hypothetical protein
MKRIVLALLLLTAASAFADEVIRCESKGGRRRCVFETPGSVTVAVRRQLSIIACTEGTNWGWRNGEVWVDNGCRADFLIIPRRIERHRERGETLICESGGHRRRCDAFVPYGVIMQRQLGHNDCIRGESWGYDREGIWVDRGCRAEFYIEGDDRHDGDRHDADRDRRRGQTVVCESRGDRTELCEADTRHGVELSRQLSGADCVFRRTWGYNDRGIWVKDGCRAEFVTGIR